VLRSKSHRPAVMNAKSTKCNLYFDLWLKRDRELDFGCGMEHYELRVSDFWYYLINIILKTKILNTFLCSGSALPKHIYYSNGL
jgi:hypothetical protein